MIIEMEWGEKVFLNLFDILCAYALAHLKEYKSDYWLLKQILQQIN